MIVFSEEMNGFLSARERVRAFVCVRLSGFFWLECVRICACFDWVCVCVLSLLLRVTHLAGLFVVKVLYSGLAETSAVELHRHDAP